MRGTRVAFNGTPVKSGGSALAVHDLRSIVATWLRAALIADDLSAPALARRAGIAKSTIYRLLAGSVQPEESTIQALGAALSVPFPGLGARPIKSDTTGPRIPQDERSQRETREMPPSAAPSHSARSASASHTPAIVAGGEERTPGPLAPDEADMALSVLQRALWAAVERDQHKGDGEARDAVYRTLKDFSVQLFALGLFQVATEIAQMAERLREGGIVG